MSDLAVKGPFVTGLPSYPGVDEPTVDSMTYLLYDDDAQSCRTIDQAELDDSYVDNNIDTFVLGDINVITMDVDRETVTLTYLSGAQTSFTLGLIDFNQGDATREYRKANGIIYPVAEGGGDILLNGANTPGLVKIRQWYFDEAKQVNDEHLEIAEIVHAFASIIALNTSVDGVKSNLQAGNMPVP